MKKSAVVFVLVVLMALTVSAQVLANPAAIAYGLQTPIVEKEVRELQPTAVLSGDVSVISMRDENIGSRAGENLEVTAFHGLKLRLSASTLNLPRVHRVWFGFPRDISEEEWRQFAERTDTQRKYRELGKKDLGSWFEAMPAGANNWQAYAPSDILAENVTTNIIIKAEGDFNHTRTRIFWLITIAGNRKGTDEERLRIRCVEPPPGLDQMPREVIFAHLLGFHPAWAAPVMSQPPGMNGPMGPMPTPTPAGGGDYVTPQELGLAFDNFRATNKEDIRAVVREELSTARPAPPAATPKPDVQEQGTTSAPGVPTELAIRIAPDGGYEVLDRENDDGYVVGRNQRVYVILSRPLKPGEAVERNISYIDEQSGTCRWTKAPISLSQFDEARRATFFYLTDPRVTIGEHALFVRVTGPNGELANTTKTLIVKEDDQ